MKTGEGAITEGREAASHSRARKSAEQLHSFACDQLPCDQFF